MTRSKSLAADVERLMAHARSIAELDESRRELADQIDAATAAVEAAHAKGQSSGEVAKLAQLIEALEVIDQVALTELEHAAATLSEVTARGTR